MMTAFALVACGCLVLAIVLGTVANAQRRRALVTMERHDGRSL